MFKPSINSNQSNVVTTLEQLINERNNIVLPPSFNRPPIMFTMENFNNAPKSAELIQAENNYMRFRDSLRNDILFSRLPAELNVSTPIEIIKIVFGCFQIVGISNMSQNHVHALKLFFDTPEMCNHLSNFLYNNMFSLMHEFDTIVYPLCDMNYMTSNDVPFFVKMVTKQSEFYQVFHYQV